MKDVKFEQLCEWYLCIKRELELRKKFYPAWIAKGKLSQERADREIKTMTEIFEYFKSEYEAKKKESIEQLGLLEDQEI